MSYKYPRLLTTTIIKKQVIKVEKLIGARNKFKDIAFKKQIKLTENKRFAEKERREEDTPRGDEKLIISKMSVPRLGFLDVVKNFLFGTLFGVFAIKLLPLVPKLFGVLRGLMKVSDFILNFGGSILNAFTIFVTKGYEAVDATRTFIKDVSGDSGLKTFDSVLKKANWIINATFIAGMLFSDLIVSDAESSAGKEVVDFVKDRVVKKASEKAAQQAAIEGAAGISARAAGGVVAGVGLISSALGEGSFQLRKYTKKVEKDTYSGLAKAEKERNLLAMAFYNTFAIPGMRFTNFFLNGVGTILDIVGAPFRYAIELINFAIMQLTGNVDGIKKQKENLGKFDARIREQIREMVNVLSFGTLAKDKGSFGSLFGESAVRSMGYASGGPVITREGEVVGQTTGRTEVKTKATRQIEIPMSPLAPGADVGGLVPYKDEKITKIEAFYPHPKSNSSMNPYGFLERTYSIAGDAKFFDSLLQLSVKMIMGDSPSASDYYSVGSSLNYFINTILDTTKTDNKKNVLSDEIGNIDISNWLSKYVKESVSKSADSIIKRLTSELRLKKTAGLGEASPSAEKGDGSTSNPLDGFGGEAQFVIGDSIAHGFAGRSGNGTETGDSLVGRNSAAVLAILKSKGDSLRNSLIDLSTGIANSTGDWKSVEEQLKYLKSIGAKVRILGVANDFSAKRGSINEKLSQLASQYGFYFYGGYAGGKDKLHGTDEDYTGMKRKRESDVKSTSVTPTGNISDLISGAKAFMQVGFPARGAAYLSGNVQQESGWAGQRSPWVLDDGAGTNKGLVSWNRGRITAAEKFLGKPLNKASNAEQIKWIKNEMMTSYKSAYNIFMNPNATDKELESASYIYLGYGDVGARYSYAKEALKALSIPKAFHGGFINQTQMVLTHPGEYVVDADSVKSFGVQFYEIINQVETISDRKNASEKLVKILSQYTEDGYPETEDDYTYYIPKAHTSAVLPQQIIRNTKSIGGFGGEQSFDPSQDDLFMR